MSQRLIPKVWVTGTVPVTFGELFLVQQVTQSHTPVMGLRGFLLCLQQPGPLEHPRPPHVPVLGTPSSGPHAPALLSSWSSLVQASITHWEHTLIVPCASTTSTWDTHLVPLQNSEPLHFWQCLSCNLTDSTSGWWSALDTHDSSQVPPVEASWDTIYCKHTWNKKEYYCHFLLFVLADKCNSKSAGCFCLSVL